MGRKKTYDRDVLIEKSMEMFRDHGFAGTSTQMLVEGLGVNRYSLYAEFGSKQALFEAALEVPAGERRAFVAQRCNGDADLALPPLVDHAEDALGKVGRVDEVRAALALDPPNITVQVDNCFKR